MKIRQEINILCTSYTGTGTVNGNERVQLDTTQYSGTVTYYFEAVYSGAASNAGNIRLTITGGTTDVSTIAGATSATVITNRSSFTPTAGQTELFVRMVGDGTRSQTVKAARIVILQDSGSVPIVSTETQIEIGSASTITATSIPTGTTNSTNPKYWLYTAANWSGTLTVFFEATFSNPASSKSSATVELQHDDGSFGATWTNDAAITTSSTTAARVRSAAITLTAGRHYRIVGASSSSKTGMQIYNAKIIIDQTPALDQQQSTGSTGLGFGDNNATEQSRGQGITAGVSGYVWRVDISLSKVGSPSDNVVVSLVGPGSDPSGPAISSSSISGTSLTGSQATYSFYFALPVFFYSGTSYYIVVSRSGSVDASNFYILYQNSVGTYSGGVSWLLANGTWNTGVGPDEVFSVYSGASIDALEAQYLLANTLFAAGTGAQTFLTKWSPDEWAIGIKSTFKHDVEAGAATTSTIELDDTTGPTQLTGSVVTNPSSEGISSAVTMPSAATTLDVKATTNGGNLTASRILVLADLSPIRPLNPIFLQAVKRASLW